MRRKAAIKTIIASSAAKTLGRSLSSREHAELFDGYMRLLAVEEVKRQKMGESAAFMDLWLLEDRGGPL